MKQFFCVVAVVCLATTGCTTNRMMGSGGQRGGILTSQRAPRPSIQRNLRNEVMPCSATCDVGCDPGCGCDQCCEPACGEPCCEPECGCEPGCDCDVCCEPECGCDPGCGVCDPCCGDDCCADGCCADGSCSDPNGCRFGKGMRGRGGLANGQICSRCGDPNCHGCLGGGAFVGAVASGFCPHGAGYPEYYNFTPGPPVGQTAYPYYTTRGPRDFLQNNPPSIGPY